MTKTSGTAAPERWAGAWTSPSCGARKYERRIRLSTDGTFAAEDRVSPCPAGVQCVWSGIVTWSGRWQPEGDGIRLDQAASGPGPAGAPHPNRLVWDAADGAPAEITDTGHCTYARYQPRSPERRPR